MQLLQFKRQKLPFESATLNSGTKIATASVLSSRPGHRLSFAEMEHFFACPYCWEQISMVLDTSVNGQIYVEDCEVCCRPIEVRYTAQDGEVNDFEARTLE
jgi:hypothetical protein